MGGMQKISMQRAQIFACAAKTERECFDRMLFSTNKVYAQKVLQVKKGDILFLYNLNTDTLYGVFRAKSDGRKNIIPEAWEGKYPYQVAVERDGKLKTVRKAKRILSKMDISWKGNLGYQRTKLLLRYLQNPNEFDWRSLNVNNGIRKNLSMDIKSETDVDKPLLIGTTLWDYPRQSYGKTVKGDNRYAGVTPAFIIYTTCPKTDHLVN